MNANPMRLIRPIRENPRAEMIREFIADIRKRRTGEKVPFGEGEIDNRPTAKTIDVEATLRRSFRKTDCE